MRRADRAGREPVTSEGEARRARRLEERLAEPLMASRVGAQPLVVPGQEAVEHRGVGRAGDHPDELGPRAVEHDVLGFPGELGAGPALHLRVHEHAVVDLTDCQVAYSVELLAGEQQLTSTLALCTATAYRPLMPANTPA